MKTLRKCLLHWSVFRVWRHLSEEHNRNLFESTTAISKQWQGHSNFWHMKNTCIAIIRGKLYGDFFPADPQCVNSLPPNVWKLHFMYEVICTSSKCCWSIYRTSKKHCGTLWVEHIVERSSPTVRSIYPHRNDICLKKFDPDATIAKNDSGGIMWQSALSELYYTLIYEDTYKEFHWKILSGQMHLTLLSEKKLQFYHIEI